MIKCEETDEGFTISWDPNDPTECVLNTWTEEDFTNAIMSRCNEIIAEHEKFIEDNNEGN